MFKVLKNNDGFSGLIGILIAIVIIGIMSAMMLPTFTARMDYKQAQYVAGVTKTIENAENAYMAKNGSFADLVTLSQNGYLSPQFLQSLQPANNPGGPPVASANYANSAGTANSSGPTSYGTYTQMINNLGYSIYYSWCGLWTYNQYYQPFPGRCGGSGNAYVYAVNSSQYYVTTNYGTISPNSSLPIYSYFVNTTNNPVRYIETGFYSN